MPTHVRYSPLPQESEDRRTLQNGKFAFPKISRLKVSGVVFVIVVAGCLIAFACFRKRMCIHPTVCQAKDSISADDSGRLKSGDHVKLHHMKKRLPQCIIIGARKAGTRALLTYLNIHPDVVGKGPEMHFFDSEEFYKQSFEAYRKEMPYSFEDQITVEKTPAYFVEPDVPERIYRMNRTIKLLLLLRDPVERTLSDYVQLSEGKRAKNKPIASFEEHVITEDGSINRSYKAVKRSIYHKHLARWLEFFSLKQIFIIDSQELVENPAAVMFKVEDFLGIEHKIKPSNFYFNKTKGFFCIQTEGKQKCLAESKGREHPEVDEVVLKRLRRFFAPHNRKLYEMIGHDFGWPEK